jgi:hypothetical protein
LPPLLDGSDFDEQDLGDRQLGLDAAGLIHYPDDTIVYGGIPFGSVLSPLELLRRREKYEVLRNRKALGLCWIVHPRVAGLPVACSSLLGVEYFGGFSMPHMWVVLVGA